MAKARTTKPSTFIRDWRKHRGLTQQELADAVGWVVSNVSQLEQGRQGYSQPGLEAVANVLRCEPWQLLAGPPSSAALSGAQVAAFVITKLADVQTTLEANFPKSGARRAAGAK